MLFYSDPKGILHPLPYIPTIPHPVGGFNLPPLRNVRESPRGISPRPQPDYKSTLIFKIWVAWASFIQVYMSHFCWALVISVLIEWKSSRFPEGSPRRSYPSYWSFIEYIEFIEWIVHCHMCSLNFTLSQFLTEAVKSCHIASRHALHIISTGGQATSASIETHVFSFHLMTHTCTPRITFPNTPRK